MSWNSHKERFVFCTKEESLPIVKYAHELQDKNGSDYVHYWTEEYDEEHKGILVGYSIWNGVRDPFCYLDILFKTLYLDLSDEADLTNDVKHIIFPCCIVNDKRYRTYQEAVIALKKDMGEEELSICQCKHPKSFLNTYQNELDGVVVFIKTVKSIKVPKTSFAQDRSEYGKIEFESAYSYYSVDFLLETRFFKYLLEDDLKYIHGFISCCDKNGCYEYAKVDEKFVEKVRGITEEELLNELVTEYKQCMIKVYHNQVDDNEIRRMIKQRSFNRL